MKHMLLISSNAWEYVACVIVEAKDIKCIWEEDHMYGRYSYGHEDSDGTAVIADGVKIVFDEPFKYQGVKK